MRAFRMTDCASSLPGRSPAWQRPGVTLPAPVQPPGRAGAARHAGVRIRCLLSRTGTRACGVCKGRYHNPFPISGSSPRLRALAGGRTKILVQRNPVPRQSGVCAAWRHRQAVLVGHVAGLDPVPLEERVEPGPGPDRCLVLEEGLHFD